MLGDGCVPDVLDDPAVEVRSLPHVGHFGFPHIEALFREEPACDYVTILDDDNALMPGAFRLARPFLRARKRMICYTLVSHVGALVRFQWEPPWIGGVKAYVPWHDSLAGFEQPAGKWSDGNFWRQEAIKHELRLLPLPGQLVYAPYTEEEKWKALGMEAICFWGEVRRDERSSEDLTLVRVIA